jgi:Trypsin-like serine proteases, typically periplasmic, contain C-terminal PDZ domain
VQTGPAAVQSTPAAPSGTEQRDDPFARLASAIVPGQGSIDLRDPPPPETTQDYIAAWRDRITRNPKAAMDRVGVELVENGYRIKPDPNIGVTLAGLRPGDVITRLNDQSVGDLARDRIVCDDVAAAGIARVEVMRDGQTMLLTFPLR